jgi:hypothetical protein
MATTTENSAILLFRFDYHSFLPCLGTVGAKAKDEAFHRAEQMAFFLTSVGFCGSEIPVL